jgi:hypothetical protein
MNGDFEKHNIEYWKRELTDKCDICRGTGVTSKDDCRASLQICKCARLARQLAKMNDPLHGLHPSYHAIKLDNLTSLSNKCVSRISNLLKGWKTAKNPYRNIYIEGADGCGKSAVAALFYKLLMLREYNVSVIEFSELASLSRMMMTNSQAFNDRSDFYHFLKEEEFLIIEDVDRRGEQSSKFYTEKLGYTLLDDLFSYRAKHPKRATIVTSKISEKDFTAAIMGGSYYYSIMNNSIKEDKVRTIKLELSEDS